MRINWYQRVVFFILGLGLCIISLLLIMILLDWTPALILAKWFSEKGFIFSLFILIFYFIFSFIIFISSFIYKESQILNLEGSSGLGEIKISLQGIKNSIRDVAQYFSEIQEIRPEIKILRGKMNLTLRIKIPVGTDVKRIVTELQQRIKIYFENVLGINLEKIEVIIDDVIIPIKRSK